MACVIRFVEIAGAHSTDELAVKMLGDDALTGGEYLQSADWEAYDGRGVFRWSPHVEDALRFPDAMAAMEAWRRQSVTHPTRLWDGKPNRPMTAYTITVENVPDSDTTA